MEEERREQRREANKRAEEALVAKEKEIELLCSSVKELDIVTLDDAILQEFQGRKICVSGCLTVND